MTQCLGLLIEEGELGSPSLRTRTRYNVPLAGKFQFSVGSNLFTWGGQEKGGALPRSCERLCTQPASQPAD